LDILKLIGIPEPSWGIVGRWTYYMIRNAAFYNPKIINMPKFKNEVLLGWIFHYYISLCWAVIYYFIFIILGVNMSYFSGLIFELPLHWHHY
jgi:E3 ubiquitin-protein ligase DOA10